MFNFIAFNLVSCHLQWSELKSKQQRQQTRDFTTIQPSPHSSFPLQSSTHLSLLVQPSARSIPPPRSTICSLIPFPPTIYLVIPPPPTICSFCPSSNHPSPVNHLLALFLPLPPSARSIIATLTICLLFPPPPSPSANYVQTSRCPSRLPFRSILSSLRTTSSLYPLFTPHTRSVPKHLSKAPFRRAVSLTTTCSFVRQKLTFFPCKVSLLKDGHASFFNVQGNFLMASRKHWQINEARESDAQIKLIKEKLSIFCVRTSKYNLWKKTCSSYAPGSIVIRKIVKEKVFVCTGLKTVY